MKGIIKSLPLHTQISNILRREIRLMATVKKEKFYSENDIAGRFNVSRITARQAVTNLAQEIEHLKAADVWIAGLEGAPEARTYTESDMTMPLAIVVGNEGEGLRRLVRERCDWLMSIPMRGNVSSLNAAIAGSVALYEVLRQRTPR